MIASRLPDDTRWQTEFTAIRADSDEEIGRTFRRRAADTSWTITTEVAFSSGDGPAIFSVFTRPFREQDLDDIVCFLDVTSGRRVVGFSGCARGFQAMLLRRREDGTLIVRPFLFFVAPDTRWRLQLSVDGAGEVQSVAFDASSNQRGVVRSRIELSSVPGDPIVTIRATSERGAFCRLRINPRALTAGAADLPESPRQLLGRFLATRSR